MSEAIYDIIKYRQLVNKCKVLLNDSVLVSFYVIYQFNQSAGPYYKQSVRTGDVSTSTVMFFLVSSLRNLINIGEDRHNLRKESSRPHCKATKPAFNVGPSSARQQNAIPMAFRWQANDCPLIVVFGSSLPS